MKTVLFLTILFTILLAGPTPAAQWEDLLANGDFADWTGDHPAAWSVEIGAREAESGPASTVTRIADGPGGRPALRLVGETATRHWFAVTQDSIPVQQGDLLELGGWFRTHDVRRDGHRYTNCQLGLQIFDDEGDLLLYEMPAGGDGTCDWTYGKRTVAAPPGAATARVIMFLSMSGAVDFADLSLERLIPLEADPALSAPDRWRTDLAHLGDLLPRLHVDPFTVTSQEAFEAELAAIGHRAGTQDDLACTLDLVRAVASLGDAHTSCHGPALEAPAVPVTSYRFADGLFITKASRPYADLLGGRVVRIGDHEIDAVWERLAPYVAHENEYWLRAAIPQMLVYPRLLHALDLVATADALPVTVVDDQGRERTMVVAASDEIDSESLLRLYPEDRPRPLCREVRGYYWSEYLPDDRTMYLQYRRCAEDPEQPMATFAPALLAELDSRPVSTFVIDVRFNSGGGSRLIHPVLQGVAERLAAGTIGEAWVITGRHTFSSASLNVAEFLRAPGVRVAGEPMGNKPNHFGQVQVLELPNTGVRIRYSTKHFRKLPGDPPTILPDLAVEESASDYLAGRDPVLEAILALEP